MDEGQVKAIRCELAFSREMSGVYSDSREEWSAFHSSAQRRSPGTLGEVRERHVSADVSRLLSKRDFSESSPRSCNSRVRMGSSRRVLAEIEFRLERGPRAEELPFSEAWRDELHRERQPGRGGEARGHHQRRDARERRGHSEGVRGEAVQDALLARLLHVHDARGHARGCRRQEHVAIVRSELKVAGHKRADSLGLVEVSRRRLLRQYVVPHKDSSTNLIPEPELTRIRR
mmetsp:Transcript_5153/g.17985  ORF Transcript_5153/g.17985 Transcript_5153/m.17985 type:complete len:231 (+) Transcript_5153:115-807(+)